MDLQEKTLAYINRLFEKHKNDPRPPSLSSLLKHFLNNCLRDHPFDSKRCPEMFSSIYTTFSTTFPNTSLRDHHRHHPNAVAANAVVELYRLVSRQDELHQKILSFSVSHDHRAVRIYGHYVLIKDILFYRHLIRGFGITD